MVRMVRWVLKRYLPFHLYRPRYRPLWLNYLLTSHRNLAVITLAWLVIIAEVLFLTPRVFEIRPLDENLFERSKQIQEINRLEEEVRQLERENKELIETLKKMVKGGGNTTRGWGDLPVGKCPATPFQRPIKDYWLLTTLFSPDHLGIDIAAPWGTPIYASTGGEVSFSGWAGGRSYGNMIQINSEGWANRYAHLSRFAVKVGQEVSQGKLIGWVGSTGNSTGSHLHFEVYCSKTALNPLKYLK